MKFRATLLALAAFLVFSFPAYAFTLSNLDDSSWSLRDDGNCTQGGGHTSLVSSPSLDGFSRLMHLADSGVSPYCGEQFYLYRLTAGGVNPYTSFDTTFHFYMPTTTYNNVGGNSLIQSIEFSTMKWTESGGLGTSGPRYEGSVGWQNVQGCPTCNGDHMFLWDAANNAWVDSGIAWSPTALAWHSIEIKWHIASGQSVYDHLILDGTDNALSATYNPATLCCAQQLEVAVQINSNSNGDTYGINVDEVTAIAS